MGYSFAAVSVRRNPRWVVTRALRRRSARSVAVGLLALTGVYLCFSPCNYAIWSRRERLSVKSFFAKQQIMLSVPPFQHPFPTIPSATDPARGDGSTQPDIQGGPFKNARFPRATTNGGGTMAKSEDGERCVVSGRECKSPLIFCRSFIG